MPTPAGPMTTAENLVGEDAQHLAEKAGARHRRHHLEELEHAIETSGE